MVKENSKTFKLFEMRANWKKESETKPGNFILGPLTFIL
jgi:hypothetical protein